MNIKNVYSRMFRKGVFIVSTLILSISFLSASASTETVAPYYLGVGDVVNVSVYDEPELSKALKIDEAGVISYPFLGDIKAKGMTTKTLQNHIARGLKGDYLIKPRVSVSIKNYAKFFIQGQVNKPGGYEYQPNLTVAKAISLGSGFTEKAAKKSIYLVRNGNAPEVKVKMNDEVNPGDLIIVTESFF